VPTEAGVSAGGVLDEDDALRCFEVFMAACPGMVHEDDVPTCAAAAVKSGALPAPCLHYIFDFGDPAAAQELYDEVGEDLARMSPDELKCMEEIANACNGADNPVLLDACIQTQVQRGLIRKACLEFAYQ
jgi:hypothetical protein